MYKILIIEDDEAIAQSLKKHLEAWGFVAMCAEDFSSVCGEFVRFSPHLVLMDISLPYYNGFHRCAEIRKLSNVPILFLSSAAEPMSIVTAVNMGGDDYITKPFDIDVLIAKVNALLRRSYAFAGTADLIEGGGGFLSLTDAVFRIGDQKIDLTKNEFRILEVLLWQKGQVVSRDTLMQKLWETDSYVDDNTLTVNIARLRKKLQQAGAEDFIKTKKGMGYFVQ